MSLLGSIVLRDHPYYGFGDLIPYIGELLDPLGKSSFHGTIGALVITTGFRRPLNCSYNKETAKIVLVIV